MEEEFEKIELSENNGVGKIKINGKPLKGLTSYSLKRGTDIIEVTFSISVPISNFKTCEC